MFEVDFVKNGSMNPCLGKKRQKNDTVRKDSVKPLLGLTSKFQKQRTNAYTVLS